MIDKINVLIFPAGSEIGIEIFNSLKYNIHLDVFGLSGKADHAKFIYSEDHYFEGDYYIGNQGFIDTFNSLIKKLNIELILPTHDSIALFLAQHQKEINAKAITSPYKTALIAREKNLIYELFKEFDFCPKIYNKPFVDINFPLFLKPNIGEGGKSTAIAYDKDSLYSFTQQNTELIVCEYLPGDELSVDCFTNRRGELLFVGPRTRERVQIGISFHSESVSLTDEILEIAITINNQVNIRGAWFFQLKKDANGRYKLLEFAVRQASTMGLYRQIGVNFALLSIFDALGMDVKIIKNDYSIKLDRCLYNRYKIDYQYDRVYIDFDDTIIINGQVNLTAVKYLYFCRNNGIRVALLTKHKYDLDQSLAKYCLSKNLFDEIILINMEDDKLKYLDSDKSIFIDNYFFDRYNVFKNKNIPVFDVDAIESLMN